MGLYKGSPLHGSKATAFNFVYLPSQVVHLANQITKPVAYNVELL
jgi:hypothetical protein